MLEFSEDRPVILKRNTKLYLIALQIVTIHKLQNTLRMLLLDLKLSKKKNSLQYIFSQHLSKFKRFIFMDGVGGLHHSVVSPIDQWGEPFTNGAL